MKNLILLIILFISTFLQAQTTISLSLSQRLNSKQAPSNNTIVPVIIEGETEQILEYLKAIGGEFQYAINNIHSARLTKSQINELKHQSFIHRIDGGMTGQLLNDSSRINNNAVLVHNGTDLDRPYKGKNVIIGILDSGIDYRHPDFLDNEGNSRIHSIWDQTKDGKNPTGFFYGYECTTDEINNGSCPSIDNQLGTNAHGTHVAGVAAANDVENDGRYSGMAPEATIIGVAINFINFGNSVLDGTKYIYDKAKELGMPCVINLSAGVYGTSHDGNDPFSKALNELITSEPGRAFTHANGNGGRESINVNYVVKEEEQFSYLKYRTANTNGYNFYIYADSIDFRNVEFQLQADKKSDFTEVMKSKFYNVIEDFEYPNRNSTIIKDTLLNGDNEIDAIISLELEIYNGVYGLYGYINNTKNSNYWRLTCKGNGKVDIYIGRLVNCSSVLEKSELPQGFPNKENYQEANRFQNMVGLFNGSDKVISVANYINTNSWIRYNGENYTHERNNINGDIHASSSRGPTRDGRIKPEISSGGNLTISASNIDRLERSRNRNDRFLVESGMHRAESGTSNSAPAVAGGIALILEKYPTLEWDEIRETVFQNARKDEFTGQSNSNTWGYGKFDAYNAIINPIIYGCTNKEFDNYNEKATVNDGSCIIVGCLKTNAENYNSKANKDSGECRILGCTNPNSINYNSEATVDNNTCLIPEDGNEYYFNIFPNPMETEGTILFGFKDDKSGISLEIYNSIGQLQWQKSFSGNINKISISSNEMGLANGVHFVILRENGNIIETKKLIKQ